MANTNNPEIITIFNGTTYFLLGTQFEVHFLFSAAHVIRHAALTSEGNAILTQLICGFFEHLSVCVCRSIWRRLYTKALTVYIRRMLVRARTTDRARLAWLRWRWSIICNFDTLAVRAQLVGRRAITVSEACGTRAHASTEHAHQQAAAPAPAA